MSAVEVNDAHGTDTSDIQEAALDGDGEGAADVHATDRSSITRRFTPDGPHTVRIWVIFHPVRLLSLLDDTPVAATQASSLWKGDAFVPVGLHNEGITCYRNSTFQALMACDQFCDNAMQHDESIVCVFCSRSSFAHLKGMFLQA